MFAHFRPFLFVFVSLILGIYLGFMLFYVSQTLFYLIWIAILGFLGIFIFSLFSHKCKLTNWFYNSKAKIICVVSALFIGSATFCVMHNTYGLEYNFDKNTDYNVVATIKTNYSYTEKENSTGNLKFLINDVSVLIDGGEVKLNKSVYINVQVSDFNKLSPLYDLSPNDKIVFSGKFTKTPVFGYSKLYEYAYKNGFEYTMYLSEADIVLQNNEPTGLDAVRKHIYNTLYQNMSPKYASLAYSVLIGDRTGLDDEIENNLKTTGVAHIIAVSGLHVGFVVVLLLGFCKLCRIRKGWAQLLLVTVVLLFYCLLCNMTPSVTRATFMAICLLSAKAFKRQSDSLSSVSLAGIIILLLHPLYVFDVSFQLSFAAVFAIILLFPLFKKVYGKWKNKKVVCSTCDTINLSLSAQIGTAPYIMRTFGYVSTYSLPVNVIIVPFFGFVYMALFVITLLSCVMPFLGWALFIPEMCFVGIDAITGFVASIPYSTIPIRSLLPIELFIWGLTMFVVSDKCILKEEIKRIASVLFICLTLIILILCLVL